jgi:oxygen-independent coproporphyrinogen III oxidase
MEMISFSPQNSASLYFHIPFCSKKCDYCHFYVIPEREQHKEQLMEALKMEWESQKKKITNKDLVSIYFGGGTPALLGSKRLRVILQWIKDSGHSIENAEITLEANPENITQAFMEGYANAGVNRVSIGIQTLDDLLLKRIGRTHHAQKAIDSVHHTKQAGIHNISIDLMYDLPGQTLDSWKKTLELTAALPITHLSLYNLTIEPHTVFFKKKELISKAMPDELSSTNMYKLAKEVMEENSLQQYEISAFAKNSSYSKHNTGYWTGRPFLGLGPSAFSHWQGQRFQNFSSLSRYRKALLNNQSPVSFHEELLLPEQVREAFVIQLRLLCGVNLKEFEERHGPLENESRTLLAKLVDQGLLTQTHKKVSLTDRGVLFYDTVASELI